jgi:membrane fusion protein (multidrug efflux system)
MTIKIETRIGAGTLSARHGAMPRIGRAGPPLEPCFDARIADPHLRAFADTYRRLRSDRVHAKVWMLLCALLVLAGWLCWATLSQVSLFEVSSEARVEFEGATYPIEAPLLGRIVANHLQVGQAVRRGDVLIEIDAMPERLQLHETQAQIQGLDPQVARLRAQIDAERGMREEEAQSGHLGSREAENRVREAEMSAQFADKDLARMRALQARQLVATRDLDRAESESGRLHAAVAALQTAAVRIPRDQAARKREREERIARLEGEVATLEAQRTTLLAQTDRLAYEIERRRIRAAVDGHVGEAVNTGVGAVVSAGVRLGSIVPDGRLFIVAQYPAQAAFGRIRAGEPATLRLEGFPWAEFGTVSARVQRVAEEVREGKVRVELALAERSSFRGTLQHGMPGTLEVTVEGVSPWGLTLRTAGQWLSRPL